VPRLRSGHLYFPPTTGTMCTPAVRMPPGLSASPGRVSEFVIEACTVVAVGMVTAAAAALLRNGRKHQSAETDFIPAIHDGRLA
jgi:hypothetical protein